MAEIASVDMKEIAKQTTVHVTLVNYKAWRWRAWLGMQLYRLGAWVMWMGIEFDEDSI